MNNDRELQLISENPTFKKFAEFFGEFLISL